MELTYDEVRERIVKELCSNPYNSDYFPNFGTDTKKDLVTTLCMLDSIVHLIGLDKKQKEIK